VTGPKSPRPIASLERLQPLDACNMRGVHSYEPRLAVRVETTWLVFNRKLCAILRDAGIELCELENEVIERPPEVVADLPDQNWNPHGGGSLRDKRDIVRRFRIELDDNGIFVLLPESLKPSVEIRKVFSCPVYSFESAVEYVGCHDNDAER
jgi:hypothetical protein